MVRAAAVLLALLQSAALAVDATITGPTGGVPGDILVLDASASEEAKSFAWSCVPNSDDKDRPTIYPIEGGSKCIICSRPGTYTVILSVASAMGEIAVTQWVVVIEGSAPKPPAPIPPRPPAPNLTGLSKTAYDAAMQVVDPHRAVATRLGESFENISAAIEAGGIKGEQQIKIETAKANVEALGGTSSAAAEAWKPWFAAIRPSTEKLGSDEEHAQAWRDLAKGLKAVR
jgi:hypothetical protein